MKLLPVNLLSLLLFCVALCVSWPAWSQPVTDSTPGSDSASERLSVSSDEESPILPEAYDQDGLPSDDGYSDDTELDADIGAFEQDKSIEEILVTGTKSNALEGVTISTTSFDATELREMRIQDISDLARFTPGLEINTAFAASNPTLFIRGIGLKDYNANSAGAVAVYRDGIVLNSPVGQLFQLFDVKNVTVMKGPQSGRFGRNATAGVIAIETNKPTGEWTSEGSFTTGNYNAIELIGALGFPIIEDTLSGRVAFTYNRRDGHTRNGCAGWDPVANGQEVVSRQAIEQAWGDLDPAATTTTVYRDSDDSFSNPLQRYLFQDSVKAEELLATGYKASINQNFKDGSGNPVYVQDNKFSNQGGDSICVLLAPGEISTYQLSPDDGGMWNSLQNRASLEEFQDLKPFTNNVHDWAARLTLLWEPMDDMSWLLMGHYGQNLSDSRHNQLISAGSRNCPSEEGEICRSPEDKPNPFQEPNRGDHVDGWSEVRAGEEPVVVKGLKPPQQPNENILEGGERGADPFLGWYDSDGQEFLDVWGVSLTGDWFLPNVSLHWLTDYEGNVRLVEDEGDASPRRTLRTDWSDNTFQVSQEIRAAGDAGKFGWLLGLYVLYEELQAENIFPGIRQQRWTQTFDQDLLSVAPFLNAKYAFFDEDNARTLLEELSLEINFRYNFERKNFGLLSEIISLQTSQIQDVIQADPVQESWNAPTGDVTLRWKPLVTDNLDLMFHTRYSRGWKTGHFNAGLTVDPKLGTEPDEFNSILTPVDPESVHAFEVGFETDMLESRVYLSAAFFRYWYTDMQIFDLVNEPGAVPTQQLLSADARILGVEANATVRPLEGLDYGNLELGVGMNWLDSTFEDFFVSKREIRSARQRENRIYDYSGNPTIAAPEWSVNGFVSYDIQLADFGMLTPRFDYTFQTQSFLDPQGLDLIAQPEYWLLDVRLGYFLPGEQVEIAIWVTNILDEQYLVDVFDLSQDFNTILQVWGEPRMFGVTVSYRF